MEIKSVTYVLEYKDLKYTVVFEFGTSKNEAKFVRIHHRGRLIKTEVTHDSASAKTCLALIKKVYYNN